MGFLALALQPARWLWLLLAVALAGSLTVACRTSAQKDETIQVSLIAPLFPPPSGPGQLTFRLSDLNNQPIDAAVLDIRGDMDNPGMVPVLTQVDGGDGGTYRAPIEWTMAGDWIVTVEATLDDGRRTIQTFDLTVTGEEEICTDEA
jgi:hypothetical protein